MTAEIAVVNTKGIALAADSAVTIGSKKIYNSANKLFTLSKHHPVGIMIYGNAEFMGIPWETLIKTYRNEVLKDTGYPKLSDYSNNFLNYLKNTSYITPDNEDIFIHSSVRAFLSFVKHELEQLIRGHLKSNKEVNDTKVSELLDRVLNYHFMKFKQYSDLPGLTTVAKRKIRSRLKNRLEDIKSGVFEQLPITQAQNKIIFDICLLLFYKGIFRNRHSGIVIAGFGADDIFPRINAYLIEGRIEGVLKYNEDSEGSFDCELDNTASILPYAQREMVDTFMCGIDPDLRKIIERTFNNLSNNFLDNLTTNTSIRIGKKKQEEARNLLDLQRQDILRNFEYKILSEFVGPVVDSVSNLPLDELASMAHALVNLTSFKRRVSMNLESVGGPIDVAVISKGDGFVWIQRKHYFKPELNHHFFNNYFR